MALPDGVEVVGPMHARYDEVLTDRALELVALLHRELDGRRRELLAKRTDRVRAIADGGGLGFLEETREIREDDSWRVADPAPGLLDRRVEITGPTDRKMTINQAKGCHPRIRDRFDLTVECIRQHYEGALNPLGEVLDRYDNFFALFGDFRGFVSFFFLNDLINDDSSVEFFAPASPAIPGDLGTYLEYRRRSIEFIQARNKRIEQWSKGESPRCDPPEPDC